MLVKSTSANVVNGMLNEILPPQLKIDHVTSLLPVLKTPVASDHCPLFSWLLCGIPLTRLHCSLTRSTDIIYYNSTIGSTDNETTNEMRQ